MKKILLLFISLLISSCVLYSKESRETIGPNPNNPEAYLEKQKRISEGDYYEGVQPIPSADLYKKCSGEHCLTARTIRVKLVCKQTSGLDLQTPVRYKEVSVKSLSPKIQVLRERIRTDAEGMPLIEFRSSSDDGTTEFRVVFGEQFKSISYRNISPVEFYCRY